MPQSETIVTAWKNGAHHSSGAGYGVKLTTKDRDAYLKREWGRVENLSPRPCESDESKRRERFPLRASVP